MGLFSRLLTRPRRSRGEVHLLRRRLRWLQARYDAAMTTDENMRHWAGADSLSVVSAASPDVRRILRQRARYEVSNNSYARGIVLTLAYDVVCTGPKLQVLTESYDLNVRLEREFRRWAAAVGLAEKLRTMVQAKTVDGEAFALLRTNPRVEHPVKLDLQLIECDQVAAPPGRAAEESPTYHDGVFYDRYGNPLAYTVLQFHPGDARLGALPLEAARIPARWMLHFFRCDRPGQLRGVSELTPALPLFAQLRRYTQAVIAAAETAADLAAVLYTDALPEDGPSEAEPFETVDIERRMMLTLPAGWKMEQFRAEQPHTGYAEFKREILTEIARCLLMTSNIALGDSSNYNYASGRLDHQTYMLAIDVERDRMRQQVLDRLWREWIREALAVPDYLPPLYPERLRHTWHWQGRQHVDPVKEANAQAVRLKHGLTTLAREYAKDGLDWEEETRQRAKELRTRSELGIQENDHAPAQAPGR